MDNVFIERLWRGLKYECAYIHAFETGSELRTGLTRWIGYYNTDRLHSAFTGATPDEGPWANRGGARAQTGGMILTRTDLSQAAKLSEHPAPSHPQNRSEPDHDHSH